LERNIYKQTFDNSATDFLGGEKEEDDQYITEMYSKISQGGYLKQPKQTNKKWARGIG